MWGTQVFIPDSIFAKERFVMWKKPSLMRRNMWYIPANNKHTTWKNPQKQTSKHKPDMAARALLLHPYIYIYIYLSLFSYHLRMPCLHPWWDSSRFSYLHLVSQPKPSISEDTQHVNDVTLNASPGFSFYCCYCPVYFSFIIQTCMRLDKIR